MSLPMPIFRLLTSVIEQSAGIGFARELPDLYPVTNRNQMSFQMTRNTQVKCAKQIATNVPLRLTGTQGASCRKKQVRW